MAEPIRFGVVGSGFMGQTWARVIAGHVPEARLVAVAGGRGAADLARQARGRPPSTTTALLARADIDAVVIATPVPTHRPLSEAAARAGKHVLVEKPMTRTRGPMRTPWSPPPMRPACASRSSRSIATAAPRWRPRRRSKPAGSGRSGWSGCSGPNAGWDIPVDSLELGQRPGHAVHGLGRARLRHRPLADRRGGHARLRPVRELHGQSGRRARARWSTTPSTAA